MRQMLPQSDGNGSVQRKLLNRRDCVLPKTVSASRPHRHGAFIVAQYIPIYTALFGFGWDHGVAIDLKAIEQLATDQSSLKAAAGLAKPAKWSGVGASHDGALVWGECAGSGANPYRVMADLRDLGNKCTCPSRKFPCKHVLALLWMKAEAVTAFAPADTPAWVSDWLGRRRAGAGTPKAPPNVAPASAKDLRAAQRAEPEQVEDPKDAARREAAAAKRSEDTERAILDALDALEQWIGDQLRMGLSAFVDDVTARCRRIAARWLNSASWCCSHAPSAPRRATPRSGVRLRPRKRARPCSAIQRRCA